MLLFSYDGNTCSYSYNIDINCLNVYYVILFNSNDRVFKLVYTQ